MRLLLHSKKNSAMRNACTNSTICRTPHDMETTVTDRSLMPDSTEEWTKKH